MYYAPDFLLCICQFDFVRSEILLHFFSCFIRVKNGLLTWKKIIEKDWFELLDIFLHLLKMKEFKKYIERWKPVLMVNCLRVVNSLNSWNTWCLYFNFTPTGCCWFEHQILSSGGYNGKILNLFPLCESLSQLGEGYCTCWGVSC